MQIPVMRRGGGIIEANTNFRTVQDTTFSYTGDYVVIEDTATTWRIKFLTSGVLTFYEDIVIDIFGVGGGGAGAGCNSAASSPGGAGGSGYTSTVTNVSLAANEPYELIIGDGAPQSDKKVLGQDGKATIFGDNILIANGGLGGSYSYSRGGNGGSGGARSTVKSTTGGIDGGNGTSKDTDGNNEPAYAGKGQGTTTREFGEATGELYAYGGNSYYYKTHTYDGDPNTGNGGDGSSGSSGDGHGGAGGSGIIVIRKSASSTSSNNTTAFNFMIVGSTTQPENPAENMIWINTDTEIPEWAIRPDEPSSPIEGMIWLQTSTQSNASADLIDENELTVYFVSANKYEHNTWNLVPGKLYKNGEWLDFVADTAIYKNGVENTVLTGGWSTTGTVTDNGSTLVFKGANVKAATTKKIGFSGFSRLVFIASNAAGATAYVGYGATNSEFTAKASIADYRNDLTTYSVNIADDGEYYIIVQSASGSNPLTIKEIMLYV